LESLAEILDRCGFIFGLFHEPLRWTSA
jgi:hypothetical protein